MAATYSGDPSSSVRDYLRFVTGDTDVNNALLQDAEYDYLISQFGENTNTLLAKTYRCFATTVGIKTAKRSLGPQSEDNTARLAYYVALADKYEKTALYSAVPPLPDYASDKVFSKDMMGNEG